MKQNTDNNNEKFTGAEIFVKCLEAEGIELVFGYPGGAVLHIYDELHKQNEVSHILVRHEQGAVHAAEGFAKSSDKPGVVLVTSGPGATNSITGIADAYMDSVPIVIFTGQVRTALIGNDAFQEVDTVGITRPCVKHNFMITDVKDMASTIKKAFYVATTGRPGPVVVDEGIELARRYGSANSAPFVSGILGRCLDDREELRKSLQEEANPADA